MTNNNTIQEEALPQLIKQSATYKMFVPRKVEEKIRYLIRKYPHTEWSGILFYHHQGKFEDGSLEIHCEDIFPMDLGTSGWTEFQMTPDVTAYIADNIDLFDCDTGLIHSHHTMGAFLSGQDTKTLQAEGNDTNCFVSLIVDTRGTYVAAITRKMQKKTEVVAKSLGTSYKFFGEGDIKTDEDPMSEVTKVIDKEVIEYFMLDVQVEQVSNPFDYLDSRFDEIEAQKKAAAKDAEKSKLFLSNINQNTRIYKEDDPKDFYNWLHTERKTSAEAKETIFPSYKEPTLFSKETMDEMVDPDGWIPDEKLIKHLVAQLVTCSLIVNKDIDLKQWIVRHMQKKYDEVFNGDIEFTEWKEFYVEFLINHYSDPGVPEAVYELYNEYLGKIAEAFIAELELYPTNSYIDAYKEVLMRYTE